MINTYLWTFDRWAATLPRIVLMAAAITIIALGIFVWFGGFGFKRILYIIVGAFCGGACSLVITGVNPLLVTAMVVGGAFAAYMLQETFLAFVIAFLAAVHGYETLIKPCFRNTKELIDVLRTIAIGVPFYNWPILLGVALAPFAIEASWFAGASAGFTSGAAGVMFFTGASMIMKRYDYDPAAMVMSNGSRVLLVLAGITIVGMVVQMLILPRISSRFAMAKEMAKIKAKKTKKTKQQDDGSNVAGSTAWRTS